MVLYRLEIFLPSFYFFHEVEGSAGQFNGIPEGYDQQNDSEERVHGASEFGTAKNDEQ